MKENAVSHVTSSDLEILQTQSTIRDDLRVLTSCLTCRHTKYINKSANNLAEKHCQAPGEWLTRRSYQH